MENIYRHNFMGTDVEVLFNAAQTGDHATVRHVMQSQTMTMAMEQNQPWIIDTALSNAMSGNHFLCVREIVAVVVQHPLYVTAYQDRLNKKLWKASEQGITECVRELLKVGDPRHQKSLPLWEAACGGKWECVKLLLPLSDPLANSPCLSIVAQNGHVDIVRVLITVCDPKEHNSNALYAAAAASRHECVDLLLPVSDAELVLKHLKSDFPEHPQLHASVEYFVTAQRQKKMLEKAVDGTQTGARMARKI